MKPEPSETQEDVKMEPQETAKVPSLPTVPECQELPGNAVLQAKKPWSEMSEDEQDVNCADCQALLMLNRISERV